MIYIDNPRDIRAGDTVVILKGWYAGAKPCESISVEIGRSSRTCKFDDRPDVREAYPNLHSQGFSCVLNFPELDFEEAYYAQDGSGTLRLYLFIGGAAREEFTLGVDTDWFHEVFIRKEKKRLRLFPNGMPDDHSENLGVGLRPGDNHYRAYVGVPEHYDLSAAGAFCLLTCLGLRQHHSLIDIGCGSLRCGKLLIPYLNAGNYTGVEPNRWLVEEGIKDELGAGILAAKSPRFIYSASPSVLCGEGPADFALANSIFSHTARHQMAEWLANLANVLSAAGVLVATFVVGAKDYEGPEWVYPGCVRYRTDTIQSLAGSAGFTLQILDWSHLHGQTWAVFAKPKFDLSRAAGPLSWNTVAGRVI